MQVFRVRLRSSRTQSCAQLGADLLSGSRGRAVLPRPHGRGTTGQPVSILRFGCSLPVALSVVTSLPMSNPAAPHPASMRMTPAERRATASLASIYGLAAARHVHHPAGVRAVREGAARRREPHADRHRARRLRPHAGDPADSVRLGLRQMGAQAGDLHRARHLCRRQLPRRLGADDRLDDRGPLPAGRRGHFGGGHRADGGPDARRRAHARDGGDRHHDRR